MFCFRVLGCFVFDLECFVFDFKGASFSTYRMFCFRVLGCFVFDLECFVFDFKGASFSTYRVLRFRPWVLRASVFVFDTNIDTWRLGVVALKTLAAAL